MKFNLKKRFKSQERKKDKDTEIQKERQGEIDRERKFQLNKQKLYRIRIKDIDQKKKETNLNFFFSGDGLLPFGEEKRRCTGVKNKN